MKSNSMQLSLLPVILCFALFTGLRLTALEVMKEGAKSGHWTMDLAAAQKMAKDNQLLLFLDFTGSDWCGWCKMMHSTVFTQPGWQDYVKDKLALVRIDFPKDKNLVPSEFVPRNIELQKKYGVSGYPTYLILDSDGKTEIGRTGTHRGITLEQFIKKIENLIQYSDISVQTLTKTMDPETAKKYAQLVKHYKKATEELKIWLKTKPENSPENQSKYLEFTENIALFQEQTESLAAEHTAKSFSPEQAREYLALNTELQTARRNLNAWLRTHPMSAENREQYLKFQAQINALMAKRDTF